MVRYTGRQKTITGAVNRNQVGLKMSGCPSRVGRSGKNLRLLGRRVNCMYGLCGPTMVNGAPWRTSGRNEPPYCRQRSTACAQAAGGVGHINSPYTRTRVPAAGKQGCTQVNVGGNTPWWYNNPAVLQAVNALSTFLLSQSPPLVLSFVGRQEHLSTDLGPHLGDYGLVLEDDFRHYEAGHTEYHNLPLQMQGYADIINSIKLSGVIIPGGASRLHIAGAVTQNAKNVLKNKTIFGLTIWLNLNTSLIAYADGLSCCYELKNMASADSGLIFESDSTAYGFKFIGYEDGITKANKLSVFGWCGDCCTKRDIFSICITNGCASSNDSIYIKSYSPMLLSQLVIGTHPPALEDSNRWKALWEDDLLEAQGLIANIGTGVAVTAYTIIGNSCTVA